MRLVSYVAENTERAGVVQGDYVVDVYQALEFAAWNKSYEPFSRAAEILGERRYFPGMEMIHLLFEGEQYLRALGEITSALAETLTQKEYLGGLFRPLASTRLLAPIPQPGKITCIGRNYADHAHEQGVEPPPAPIYFLKSRNAICGPGAPIVLPINSTQVDYEAEFAVVIGKGGKNIPEERALEHVAGYMILNDVSARDMQFGDKQWYRGKSCDTFAPCGPWLVTKDEVPDPHNLRIFLTLNGEIMQDANTSDLIFKVPYLISYLSQSVTWEPGDVLSTGTPGGVGVFRKPPVFLQPGDTVSITVERLGTLTNPVVSAR
jgi:2-keto-4-pentenoate hydratase/2-oxohepta-3-ene-1,7-dioic acid hydratase in catechol pathway